MLMKRHHAHTSIATVPALHPPGKVGGTRGRVGAAPTRTSFHISFSFRTETTSALHWLRSLSPQGRGDLGLHSFQRWASLPVVQPFCCGRAVASQPHVLVVSSSSGSTAKSVLRNKLFSISSPKQFCETDTAFLASGVQRWPQQNGRKTISGVSLTESTELPEELFRWCLLIVLTLLFLVKMLKTELHPSLCSGLVKAFFTKKHAEHYLSFLEHISHTTCAKSWKNPE